MHSKQNIEDCVKDQVRGWDYTRPVEVCLTSGYGHPLRWILYEFEPATLELLGQYQYLQNVNTRQSERREKWSPPLGITKLEPSDEFHFKNYLDDLMADEPLAEFPWICFEEESLIDNFQATMLAMICELYRVTSDYDVCNSLITRGHCTNVPFQLKQLLRRIIRMLIVTYIMGHTLTITEDTLPMVHTHLRNPYKPANLAPHTSPRLANRQLKFFFHVLRNSIYEDILKWQQATLHTSGGKNTTWLSTFIVMLAFAMVLEEAQRTIQIQADAKWRKRENSYDGAQQEASNACERIDERFQLLIGLFQCKYRDKKWVRGGSFGPQTPRLRDAAEHNFCAQLRSLLEERRKLHSSGIPAFLLLTQELRKPLALSERRAILFTNTMPVYHTPGSPFPSPISRASWLMTFQLILTAYYTLLFLF
jgi:hypothetical protein